MPPTDLTVRYMRYRSSAGWEPVDGRVIAEAAVTLAVNGEPWLSFTCTPTDLDALAAGFLYNEGVISSRAEIAAIDVCKQGDNLDVWLNHPVERPALWQRTSGCGGGVTSVQAAGPPVEVKPGEKIAADVLLAGMQQMLQRQSLYRETGGVHSSAIFDGEQIRVWAEDIGRHNTLDKLAGRLLLDDLHIHPMIVLATGRISSEMLQKSAQMGAVIVISRTSPTSQSVALAEAGGITLVGYARRDRFQVYSHPERILRD
jgi:FdhD protein